MAIAFNPELLRSRAAISAFLNCDTEAGQIVAAAAHDQPHQLANCWNVIWLTTTVPFKVILAVFLACIGLLLGCVGISSWSRQVSLLAKHLSCELTLSSSLMAYGQDLIAPFFNFYAWSAQDIYLQATLPLVILQPEPDMADVFHDQNEIDFWHSGVCRGITNWFLKLYLSTKDECPDLEAHLRAIAAQFYPGAPRQAALLQALNFPEKDLLNLRREPVANSAQNLEPGLYELFLPRHRMAYIKVDAQLGYLIDPTLGIIRLRGADQAARVLAHCQQYPNTTAVNFVKVSA